MDKYFIKVLRFKNSDVENDIEQVVRRIQIEVSARIKSPPRGGFSGMNILRG
jgi:very-short-patch-repair endonuclease